MIIAKFFWAAFISDMVVESQVFSNMVQFFEWTIYHACCSHFSIQRLFAKSKDNIVEYKLLTNSLDNNSAHYFTLIYFLSETPKPPPLPQNKQTIKKSYLGHLKINHPAYVVML